MESQSAHRKVCAFHLSSCSSSPRARDGDPENRVHLDGRSPATIQVLASRGSSGYALRDGRTRTLDSRCDHAGMMSLIRPTRNPLVWGLGAIFAPRPQGKRVSPPRGVGSLSCEAGGQRGGAERAVHTHPIACIARSGQQYNPTRHPCACHPRAVRRKACYALVLVSCSCSERATCRSSLPIG